MVFNFVGSSLARGLEDGQPTYVGSSEYEPLHHLAKFAACLSPVVGLEVDYGGGPAGPYQHVIDLGTGAPVVGEPCNAVDVGSQYWKPQGASLMQN